MKRFLIFVSAHLFLFLLVIAYQAQADDEEWTIDQFNSLAYARVSGEVTHGDSLNFFISQKVIVQKFIIILLSTLMKNLEILSN